MQNRENYIFLSYLGTLTELNDLKKYEKLDQNDLFDTIEQYGIRADVEQFILQASQSHKLIMISSLPELVIRQLLGTFHLSHYFLEIHGEEHAKTFWLEKVILEEGINRNNIMFIGSTLEDYLTSDYCKIPFVCRNLTSGQKAFSNLELKRFNELTEVDLSNES